MAKALKPRDIVGRDSIRNCDDRGHGYRGSTNVTLHGRRLRAPPASPTSGRTS